MRIGQRLRAVDWSDSDVQRWVRRVGPVAAAVVAVAGSLLGTATGVGGAVGAGIGGGIGALMGYAIAGLSAASIERRSTGSR